MNTISIFSGAGGFDIGLEAAGLDVRLAIEIDADCRETMRANRPEWRVPSTHDGDLSRFSAREILRASGIRAGKLDVLAGGPPCQSFSNFGNKRGASDPRGKLSLKFFDLIQEMRPHFFVFENVPAILRYRKVISTLSSLRSGRHRYNIGYAVLNAADYGVPQIRKRVFIIGRADEGEIVFPSPTHAPKETAARLGLRPYKTVRDALSGLSVDLLLREDNRFLEHSDEMIQRMSFVGIGQNFRAVPRRLRPPCWKNGTHQGADTFGRLDPDKPSVTIRCSAFNPTKGRYIHPTSNRGLSTLEMAALQGFPSEYRFVGSMTSVGRQIGNAVPPPLATQIGDAIFKMAE